MSGRPTKEQAIILDAKAAEVFAIYAEGALTQADIAERLGVSTGVVRRLIERARANTRGVEAAPGIVDAIDLQQRQIRIDQRRIEERLGEVHRENAELIERQRRQLAELKRKSEGPWEKW